MSDVLDWSNTAGGNTSTPPDGSPEGQAPSTVNDSIREIMAALKRFQEDIGGEFHITGGSGDDYTVTLSQDITAYTVGQRFAFEVDRANGGAVTLNINGVGAKDLTKVTGAGGGQPLGAGDLQPNMVIDVVYKSGDRFEMLSPTSRSGGLDVSTRAFFQQTAAPTGWTKVTSGIDDRALRVTTGDVTTGGSSGFTSIFTDERSTGGTALTIAQMPAHAHSATVHGGSNGPGLFRSSTSVSPSTATTQSAGGGQPHDHDMDLGVRYIDTIVAVKD